MKTITYLLILFISLPAFAIRNVQQAECLPNGVNWPVKAVYLHGLFKAAGGDTNNFRQLEANNRAAVEQIATMLQIRIAVPVSPVVSSLGWRRWQGNSLTKIEQMASAACGAPLVDGRALIGFSNGGYRVKEIVQQSCSTLSKYKRLISIGAPRSNLSGCGKLDQVVRHEFPPRRAEYDLPTKLDLYLNR